MSLKSIVFIFAAFYVTSQPINAQAEDREFSIKKYLSECGGKIYSTCDSEKLNQETIYEEAKQVAVSQNKTLMVVIGADWCPACRAFNKMVAEDKNRSLLMERAVVVDLNGDLASTKALAKKINISYLGYPQAFILDPKKDEVLKVFYPSTFSSVEKLVAHLDLKKSPMNIQPKPLKIGTVDVAFLESDIELHNNYGRSTFYKNPQTNYEKYINQGIASFHAFHYLDAYRAFNMAVKAQPDRSMGYVGQILAVLNLGNGQESSFFTNQAATHLISLIESKKLSPQDLAWANFGLSFRISKAWSYTKEDIKKVKDLNSAYSDVVKIDKDNLDGQVLLSWLMISTTKLPKDFLLDVLKKEPQNGGAHHYLTHIAEMENDMKSARHHAFIYKDIAKGSAHAQHMYGHTLPQKGAWKEAYNYFVQAHNIHLVWAEKYNVKVEQDWHYSHNLDLMAATLLGLNEMDNAKKVWYLASQYDSRATDHFLWLTILTDTYPEADLILKYYEKHSTEWKNYIRPIRAELELNVKNLMFATEEKGAFNELMFRMKKSFMTKEKDKAKLSEDIIAYFANRFTTGGFDGWSNAYIELLRFKRLAKMLSMDDLIKDIAPLEFTIQSGSLCGSNPEKKSLTKCIE